MKNDIVLFALSALSVPAAAQNALVSGSSVLFRDSANLGSFATQADCKAAAQARSITTSTVYQCRENLTVTPVSAPPPPSPPPPTGAVVTYSTTFDSQEYPLSESGKWFKAANAWTYVRSSAGQAYGTNGITNSYDDSVAFLTKPFGPDQTVEAVVQVNPGTIGPTHEVELWLRGGSDSNNLWGYELCFWRSGQVQLFLWRGPYGAVEEIYSTSSLPWTPSSALKTGDRIKAQIIGTTVKAWINDVLKVHATTTHYAAGQPGIGFFIRPGGSNNLLTLTSVSASSN